MSTIEQAVLGLGANLGDPIQQIIDARVALSNLPGVLSWQCSSMYLSSPVGYSNQPNFINCVLLLQTCYQAEGLFELVQEIERNLGRVRVIDNQNAPRSIDIDMLMFSDQVIDKPDLTIPHPRMNQRLFVLEPLLELGIDVTRNAAIDFSDQQLSQLAI